MLILMKIHVIREKDKFSRMWGSEDTVIQGRLQFDCPINKEGAWLDLRTWPQGWTGMRVSSGGFHLLTYHDPDALPGFVRCQKNNTGELHEPPDWLWHFSSQASLSWDPPSRLAPHRRWKDSPICSLRTSGPRDLEGVCPWKQTCRRHPSGKVSQAGIGGGHSHHVSPPQSSG